MKSSDSRKTSDAVEIIDRIVGEDAELRQMIAEERTNAEVAELIREARAEAGLTQKELARRAGTTQSVIARLENPDYRGHSVRMLQRIARALDRTVDLRFVKPAKAHRKRLATDRMQ